MKRRERSERIARLFRLRACSVARRCGRYNPGMADSDRSIEKATAKLAKTRLLDPDVTFAICADHKEAGCASAGQLRTSWKHLKRRSRAASKAGEATVAAVPLQCIDVCKFGPLLCVTARGEQPQWFGQATPDRIDALMTAVETGQPLPQDDRLTLGTDDAD